MNPLAELTEQSISAVSLIEPMIVIVLGIILFRSLLSIIDHIVGGISFRLSGYSVGDSIVLDGNRGVITRMGLMNTQILIDNPEETDILSFRVVDNMMLKSLKIHKINRKVKSDNE